MRAVLLLLTCLLMGYPCSMNCKPVNRPTGDGSKEQTNLKLRAHRPRPIDADGEKRLHWKTEADEEESSRKNNHGTELHRRSKRNCWYEFDSHGRGTHSFKVVCSTSMPKLENIKVPVASMATQHKTKPNSLGSIVKGLLRIMGYVIYAERDINETNRPNTTNKARIIGIEDALSEYVQTPSNSGQRQLTSAERKSNRASDNPLGHKRKSKKRKKKSHRRKNTSAERERDKKKRPTSSHHNGGGSKENESVWTPVIEPNQTNTLPVPATHIPEKARQVTGPVIMTPKSKSVTPWWKRYMWLFDTSITITGPDGTRWYLGLPEQTPTTRKVTAAPYTTKLSEQTVMASPTKQLPFTSTLEQQHGRKSDATTLTPPNPNVDPVKYPLGAAFPAYATKRTFWEEGKPWVRRTTDTPHRWFPDGQGHDITHRWYKVDVNPTKSHRWFTGKNRDSEKDIHRWFGQHTKKPVTSHSWYPDGNADESHTWFGQNDGNAPAAGDTSYWWWASAFRADSVDDGVRPSSPTFQQVILKKFLKTINSALQAGPKRGNEAI